MNIGGYRLADRLCATAGGPVYEAHCSDGTSFLLKVLDRDSAIATDELCFRQEYNQLQSLQLPAFARPLAMLEENRRVAMVLEHFAGECLESVLSREQRLALPAALKIASHVASALSALHAADVVHGDIRPANILVAPDYEQVLIADLSHAASRIVQVSMIGGQATRGHWAYVSPEQTGRMNRPADQRADLYSLGIILHRLLTGELPFHAPDPLGWVHCHLAQIPPAVSDVVREIPRPVSDIVLKLLAKMPEDRYQSARGLLADLKHCLEAWHARGRIEPFGLGQGDISDRLLISHKLYGREGDIAKLLGAFEKVTTTGVPMLVTVSGYSGVGKSALVNELQRPIVQRRGNFISGKFDQYKRDFPYATLVQAFGSLVRQILAESEANIEHWRDALREALGPDGQLIVSLIPQLQIVIGPQPPVQDLPPQDAQRRFQFVFRRFIGAFTRAEHPLVLFLDDLQWLDAETLTLLTDLATHEDERYLLLVGAYRDNEVDDDHRLMRGLATIRQAGGAVQSIVLAPLALDDVAQLVAESLHCPHAEVQPLAQLLLEKSGGNPFFTLQFLTTLAEEKLLRFDSTRGAWIWDLPAIHAKGYTDNVVDFMVGKLTRLPRESQDALTQLACLGNASDVATLGLVIGQPVEAVRTSLSEAVATGLVFLHDDIYTFLHDRVQEAAYSLIPETLRAGIHLRIGRILESSLAHEAIKDRIFDVVSQLNRGSSLVESQQERDRIAELNLQAGNRAKAASAYASALAHFAAGAGLLKQDCWKRRHELMFQLALNQAECELLTGSLVASEEHLTGMRSYAATTSEQALVACLRMDLYITLDHFDRAVGVGLDYLRSLGIDWSAHPTEAEARAEYEQIWSRLGDRAIEDLIDLPAVTDPAALATLDVLIKLAVPSSFTDVTLSALISCKAVNLGLEHGNCDGSCFSYVRLGMIAGPVFGNYKAAYRFARLGYEQVERRGFNRYQANIYLMFGSMVIPWAKHVKTGCDLLRRSFEVGIRSGDFIYAAHSCNLLTTHLLASGDQLSEVQREAEHGLAFAQRAGIGFVIDAITSQLGLIRTLRGLTPTIGTLDDTQYDERRLQRRFANNPSLAIAELWHWVRKLQARFLAGDHAGALEAASRAKPSMWMSPARFETAEYHFYSALAHAALYDSTSDGERQQLAQILAAHHARLKAWADNCPENFENRAALVAAEIARIEGRQLDAQRFYEEAIRSARKNGFVQNEGLAHELAARFYLALGLTTSGDAHIERARNCYLQWGAAGKVRQLEGLYPMLSAQPQSRDAPSPTGAANLDLVSLAKASRAISGQLLLDELAESLLRIVLENAAAQAGYLLLVRGEAMVLAAEASVDAQGVQVRVHGKQTATDSPLPAAILNYVRRSRDRVLLSDTAQPHAFSGDPYFVRASPKSLLCLPILSQSALSGMLYLENHLVVDAFPPERLMVLDLLASQAAISLENARLYADLKQENKERMRAQENLREQQSRVHRLVDSNIIGVFFWDLEGGILEANEAFMRMIGHTREDLASGTLRWKDLTPPEYESLDAQASVEVRQIGTCAPYEKEFVRKDGSRLPVLIGAALFEGSRDSGVAFVLDLSERKQAEADREARQVAEMANQAKSRFLANMSHELRTPLNAILGFAQVLLNHKTLGEQEQHGVTVIKRSGEHLLNLINDILDLAKVEAGALDLSLTDVDLCEFLTSTADLVREHAERKQLVLACELPSLPLKVRADAKRLSQVLLNLLSNAVKFTEHGKVKLRVGFTAPSRFRFEVQDTGVGIPSDERDLVFQPFVQVGDRERRIGGTGLGLAISQQLVQRMGGEIKVNSRPGEGSTFAFELDLQVVESGIAPAAARTEITGYEGPPRKILVVDDVADSREVIVAALAPLGFETREAVNGRDCLEIAAQFVPDLIVMDLMMPVMSGMQAIHLLKQQLRFKTVPVIIVSASASNGDAQSIIAELPGAFVPKPIDLDQLLAHIGALLKMSWRYAPSSEADAEGVLDSSALLVVPPEAEMEELYQLARKGHMRAITEEASRLAARDARYGPFAALVRRLAGNYQSKAILTLVGNHVKAR